MFSQGHAIDKLTHGGKHRVWLLSAPDIGHLLFRGGGKGCTGGRVLLCSILRNKNRAHTKLHRHVLIFSFIFIFGAVTRHTQMDLGHTHKHTHTYQYKNIGVIFNITVKSADACPTSTTNAAYGVVLENGIILCVYFY